MSATDVPPESRRWEGWEYQELVVPVSLCILHWRHPDYVGAAAPRVQLIIRAALEEATSEGWRADEPIEFTTLFSRARVRTSDSVLRWRISSVAIRLARPISWGQLVPHG